ncbi:MAG: hypothetical protein WCD59_25425, partial [Pseudolabrys sp.]
MAIALMFLEQGGRGDRMKSGWTLVSRLTNVQPAGLIHFGGGTPLGSRLSSGVASQNAVCQENLHEDQSRGSMDYGC